MSKRFALRGRRMVSVVAALGMTLGVAACGGDDDDGGSSAASTPAPSQTSASQPAAAKPTGTPVKIMVVAAVDTPIQDYPDLFAAGKAAANAINAAGGLNGQPIEIETCNDKSEPNGAAACGRQAVTDKVAAVTGYSIGTATMLPILDKAGIQYIGGFVSTPGDWAEPNSWPLTGGSPLSIVAMPLALQANGATSVVPVVADIAASKGNIASVQQGAKGANLPVKKPIPIPIDATDFAPYVQQLKNSGADSATTTLSFQQILQLTKAAKQLGLDVPFANLSLSMSPELLKELGSDADGTVITGTLPPVSSQAPGIKQFNQEMDAAGDAGVEDTDNRRAATVETWLALHAIEALAKNIDGTVDAASLTQALKTAKNVDLLGLVDWTPSTPGPKAYPRVSNGTIYPMVVKGGEVVENGQPFDVYEKVDLNG